MSRPLPVTIAAAVERELEVRKSRFIARIEPVGSVSDAEEAIAAARRRHADANHHCTAMLTGVHADQARSSDDGEPSGTAGMPRLEVLRRREVTDVVAIVTRYFGGVKLGAGGLVRAYASAVSTALDDARTVRRVTLTRVRASVPHADAGRVEHLLRDWAATTGAVVGDTRYDAQATLEVWVPAENLTAARAELATWSSGAITPTLGPERVVDVSD